MTAFTVAGTVRDASGNTTPWSASATVDEPASALSYVGSSFLNNGDPTGLEAACGRNLGTRRTFWNLTAAKVTASIATAKADAQAGRIAWVSYDVAVTNSWASAVTGAADAAIQSLATKLATVPGEVWVALSHEPEGDGDLTVWKAMQQRLLPMLQVVPNVKTSIITTGFDTYLSHNAAQSMDALWPGSMADIMGLDGYNAPNGWREMKVYYDPLAQDAADRGVPWAIAETGYTDAQAAQDPDWLTRAYDDMANHPIQPGIALTYFNSTANSGSNTWPLGTGVKRDKFAAILNRSHA